MKLKARAAFLLNLILLVGALPGRISAQDVWIPFSDGPEFFSVSFPARPVADTVSTVVTNEGNLDVNGKSYLAKANGAVYALWALTNSGDPAKSQDLDTYLDAAAELVWEGLLKPARDRLPDDRRRTAGMSYSKELAAKPLPGREYTVTLDDMTGTIQFFVAESRIFVLMAMGPIDGAWTREPFFASFTVSPSLVAPRPADVTPTGIGAGVFEGQPAETSQTFKSSETNQRARVLHKPEPSYTESARKFSITGTVVLRAIFSKDGTVKNIVVLRKLPHGLTKRAIDAASTITFSPAIKDGQPVSTWIQLEYNFNLF